MYSAEKDYCSCSAGRGRQLCVWIVIDSHANEKRTKSEKEKVNTADDIRQQRA